MKHFTFSRRHARRLPFSLPFRALFIILSTVISLALLFAAQASSSFADWYSDGIYPIFVGTLGRVSGLFPFSVSELLLYLFLFLILFVVVRLVALTLKKQEVRSQWKNLGLNLLTAAAVLFLLYTLFCGINYGRTSFSDTAGIETSSYTVAELTAVCESLAEKVNTLSEQVSRDTDSGISLMGDAVGSRAKTAMQHLGTLYPELDGYYPKPKGLLIPALLSVQNLSGIYSPFTVEANYNSAMTEYNLPFTACHELSHLRGFMQEEEANFIAWLACINSDDTAFRYSGYLQGWLYASNQLYEADYESYRLVSDKLAEGAKKDLSANNAFWAQYEGRIAEVSNQINDGYLKANGQEDGVMSYDRMVDLIIAYYRK